ncbi:myristylprotein / IMV protein [Squirrelpox virus]|uniref:Myristylprotein / IMV protein n=1 Tax=Squirrelpox virus TaxID=240426 RepID=U3UB98_9POXV|nr:myristylprotein / IMV protein [Squirrelpox virus]CCD83237.1 myristylprotein / IMV protein [Squirrelpox virus]
MGASLSLQTTVNVVSERIRNNLETTAGASATANCNVNIGSIIFHKNSGCNLSVRNMCSAEADAQLEAVLKAATETYEGLTTEQKAYVPGLLTTALNIQTSVSTVVKDFETHVRQSCNSTAVVNDNITVQNIQVDECTAPAGSLITMEFVNTGTSKGNCAVKALMDVLTKSSTTMATQQAAGVGLNPYLIAAAVAILVLVLLYYAKKMFFTSTQDKIKIILANKPDVHWTTYLDTFFSNSPSMVTG